MNANTPSLPSEAEQEELLDQAISAQRAAVSQSVVYSRQMDYATSNRYIAIAHNFRLVRNALEHTPQKIRLWSHLRSMLSACSQFAYKPCAEDFRMNTIIQTDIDDEQNVALSCGLFFDGERDKYVRLGNPGMDNGDSDFTISVWFFQALGGAMGSQTLVNVGDIGSCVTQSYVGWSLRIRPRPSTNQIAFEVYDPSGPVKEWVTSDDVVPGQWNHVTIVRTGGSASPAITIYLNGVAASTYTQGSLPGGTPWASQQDAGNAEMTLGATRLCGGSIRYPLAGLISDYISFPSTALTAARVQALYGHGVNPEYAAVDLSGSWNVLPLNQSSGGIVSTVSGSPIGSLVGFSESELQENGGAWQCRIDTICSCSAHRYITDVRASLGAFDPVMVDGGVVAFDVYIEGDTDPGQELPVLRLNGGAGQNLQSWLEWDGNAAYDLFFQFEDGAETVLYQADGSLSPEGWHRVAFIVDRLNGYTCEDELSFVETGTGITDGTYEVDLLNDDDTLFRENIGTAVVAGSDASVDAVVPCNDGNDERCVYAVAVTATGAQPVENPDNILGPPDPNAAALVNDNSIIYVDMGEIIPSGTVMTIGIGNPDGATSLTLQTRLSETDPTPISNVDDYSIIPVPAGAAREVFTFTLTANARYIRIQNLDQTPLGAGMLVYDIGFCESIEPDAITAGNYKVQVNGVTIREIDVNNAIGSVHAYVGGQDVGATMGSPAPIELIAMSYVFAILGTHSSFAIPAGYAIRMRNFTTYSNVAFVSPDMDTAAANDYANAGYLEGAQPCGTFENPQPTVYYSLGEGLGTNASGVDYRNGALLPGQLQSANVGGTFAAQHIYRAYPCESAPPDPSTCNCFAHYYDEGASSSATMNFIGMAAGETTEAQVPAIAFDVYPDAVDAEISVLSLADGDDVMRIFLRPDDQGTGYYIHASYENGTGDYLEYRSNTPSVMAGQWQRILVQTGLDTFDYFPFGLFYLNNSYLGGGTSNIVGSPTLPPANPVGAGGTDLTIHYDASPTTAFAMRNLMLYDRTLSPSATSDDWAASGYPEGIAPCKAAGYPSPDIQFILGDQGDSTFAGTDNRPSPPVSVTGTRSGGSEYVENQYDC